MNRIERFISQLRLDQFRDQCQLLKAAGYNKTDGLEVIRKFLKLEIKAVDQEIDNGG